MVHEVKLQLDPLIQLLSVMTDAQLVPRDLFVQVKTLNALLEDFGEVMGEDMQARWKDRMAEAVSDCSTNKYGIAEWLQKIYSAALRALEGRFYEVVEKDYLMAGSLYEEAAKTMAVLPSELYAELADAVLKEDLSTGERHRVVEADIKLLGTMIAFLLRLPDSVLWDWAGDAYCQVQGKVVDARKCYEQGIEILRSTEVEGVEDEQWQTCLYHLSLSLARLLMAFFDEWDEVESLYRKVSDTVFFSRSEKTKKEYRDLCYIIGEGTEVTCYMEKPDWAPHIPEVVDPKHKKSLTILNAEFGQRGLDILKEEFENSEEGFPVPETYYLVACLGRLYTDLKEYDKCANIITRGSFDDIFLEWAYDELDSENDWAYAFLQHMHSHSFAEGLLQRPDYKEFKEAMEKTEKSHQRQEWGHLRLEKKLKEIGNRTFLRVENDLVEKYPWSHDIANIGSVINSELLYLQLSKQNWGEVVGGYCNAVEEELKQSLYQEYLKFYDDKVVKGYEDESQRRKEKGSVLHFIASIYYNKDSQRVWAPFVADRKPEHREFLLNELPRLLTELIGLRSPSAHGRMPDRKKAEKAREAVLGTPEGPGLLERLVALRQSSRG